MFHILLSILADNILCCCFSVHGEHEGDAHNKSISIGRPLLTVSNDGIVQSYGTLGRAMVVITVMDDHGLRQTLSVIVQVS